MSAFDWDKRMDDLRRRRAEMHPDASGSSEPAPLGPRSLDADADPTCPTCVGRGYLEVRANDELRYATCRCTVLGRNRRLLAASPSFRGMPRSGLDALAPRPEQYAAHALAAAYATDPATAGWLVLLGDFGSGKTRLAAALAWDVCDRLRPTFIKASRLAATLRAAVGDHAVMETQDRYVDAPFLVIDDLGAQATTDWVSEALLDILDLRYQARSPTVLTSNLPLGQLGGRIASRCCDRAVARVAVVRGQDVRVHGVADRATSAAWTPPWCASGAERGGTSLHSYGDDEVVCRLCDSRPCLTECPAARAGGPR